MQTWIPRYPLWYFWSNDERNQWNLVDCGSLTLARARWDELSQVPGTRLSGRP